MKQRYIVPSNKKFGFFFSFIFLITSIYFSFFDIQKSLAIIFIILSIIFISLAFFSSKKLNLLNRLWFKFGLLLGQIVSPIVCGLIYFLIIVPFGLILKIRMLFIKKNNLNTYWKIIKIEKFNLNYFKRQY